MTTTGPTSVRVHACVFFDDGGFELFCACGERALEIADEHGDGVLVLLTTAPSVVTTLPDRRPAELAVSA